MVLDQDIFMANNEIIYGKRSIIEALRSGVAISQIAMADNIERDSMINDILRKAKRAHVEVTMQPRRKIEALTGEAFHSTQGICAFCTPYEYADFSDMIAKATGNALIVVCDHITDVGNFGAIVRSAESCGATGLVIPNRRSASVNSSAYKTSAGAVAHLPIAQISNVKRALEDLKSAGFWIVGATEHASEVVWDIDLTGKIAMVVGNERDGISDLVLKTCDIRAKLPQLGCISSLNVAQASTVFMYEWLRQNYPGLK